MQTEGRRTSGGGLLGVLVLSVLAVPWSVMAESTLVPHVQHAITIDATQVQPPTWWHLPGVTPIIWSLDPESTDAFRTIELRELMLRTGSYRFGTFTFDFPFVVTQEETVDFATALDQCVTGRGTRALHVRCGRTQPYGGLPEY